MADSELRDAERALAADNLDPESWERVQALRVRAGRPLLCVECGEADDAREEHCECDVPRCAACHEGVMEHGHRHVHDSEADPVQCCRECFAEVMARRHADTMPTLCPLCGDPSEGSGRLCGYCRQDSGRR